MIDVELDLPTTLGKSVVSISSRGNREEFSHVGEGVGGNIWIC